MINRDIKQLMDQKISEITKTIYQNREKFYQAFIAETGLFPSECMLVEERTEKGINLYFKPMTHWQPISTAPKNGTIIDVYLGNSEFPERRTDVSFRYPKEEDFALNSEMWEYVDEPKKCWIHEDGLSGRLIGDDEPTHWQPLPEPPKERE